MPVTLFGFTATCVANVGTDHYFSGGEGGIRNIEKKMFAGPEKTKKCLQT